MIQQVLDFIKIGHALHDLDPVFNQFSRASEIRGLTANLATEDPLLLQSMYIFKQPNIGGEVTCHQDSTFLYTEPARIAGLWFTMEGAFNGKRLSLGDPGWSSTGIEVALGAGRGGRNAL